MKFGKLKNSGFRSLILRQAQDVREWDMVSLTHWVLSNHWNGEPVEPCQKPWRRWMVLFLFLSFASCSTFFGDSTNSTGDSFIDVDSQQIDFSSAVGYTTYQSIKFTNNAESAVTIINVVFRDNNCGDFALYSITRPSGTEVVGQGEVISATVTSGSYVNINVSYSRSSCIYTDYETTLYVYFTDGTTTSDATATLIPHEGEAPVVPVSCDTYERVTGFTDLTTSGQPDAGTYYLRVDRMRAYIFPLGISGQDSLLGTDVDIPEDSFENPYLQIIVDDSEGNFTFYEIPECEFILPSNEENILMFGADSILTTSEPYTGVFDENGDVTLNDIAILMRADGIDESSLIPDENGTFQVTISVSLTTQETTEDEFLGQVFIVTEEESPLNLFDADGNGQYNLVGEPLTDGKITLVGAGMLTNEDDIFIGSEAADIAIFGNETEPTLLYVQIEATLTQGGGTE